MKTPIAWLNLVHQKKRTLVAVAGVAFAVLLIFMQLGFFGAAEGTATIVYDELSFDIILISPQYIDINRSGLFPIERVAQAKSVAGVVGVSPINVSSGEWRNRSAAPRYVGKPQTMMIMGLRPQDEVFRRDGKGIQNTLDQFRAELGKPGVALVDTRSKSEFGAIDPGHTVELGPQRVYLAGQFTLGTGFGANGLVLVSDETFVRARPGFPSDRVSLGLIRLAPGIDADDAAKRLREALPPDVIPLTAAQMRRRERDFWVEQTSLGLIFRFGVGVALFVGVVFVYQVIASDIANRLLEFATLKAMGYGPAYLAGTVLQQALLIAGLAFGPGFLGSLVLYALARRSTGIPITMTFDRAVIVLVMTTLMCGASGVLALRKVQSADPAELF